MLAEDLDAREHVLRREIRHLTLVVPHQRRIGNGAFDEILADGRPMCADAQRDLGAALQHVAHNPFMCLARLIADGIDGENRANALDHGRLAGATPADEHVEVGVEVNSSAVEKAPFPSEHNDLRVLLRLKLALLGIEADAGARIEEGLS